MNNLPNEIIFKILSYCNTIGDFDNWSLVSWAWHYGTGYNKDNSLIKSLKQTVYDINGNRYLNSKTIMFEYYLTGTNINILTNKTITGLYYVTKSPNPDNKILIDMGDIVIVDSIDTIVNHPYNYGSKMLTVLNSGYLCVLSCQDNCKQIKINICSGPIIIGYTVR